MSSPVKTAYDTHAPKRPVNLSLNEDLVAQARRMTSNLSAEVESLLAEFVARQQRERDAHRENVKRGVDAWNKFMEKHGGWADEFSTL
jgi:antitoxin CcdA